MTTRRGRGEGTIIFDHEGSDCRDAKYHKSCDGRWRGVVSVGTDVKGNRIRKKVSGPTKQAVRDKLKELQDELGAGVRSSGTYTVRQCAEDWLAHGLDGRSDRTHILYTDGVEPLLAIIGDKLLRTLTATHVRAALVEISATRSTRTVQIARNCLSRAIKQAEGHDLVKRNVAELAELPSGQEGRPSKAFTLDQAKALMKECEKSHLHAYIVLSLLTGVRPEEARALRWDLVDLDGDPDADPPVPPHVDVWRSTRQHGDTKTEQSRRTLAIPPAVVEALRLRQELQDKHRANAGDVWQDNDLVFTTKLGNALSPNNIRRDFRKVCEAAGLGRGWSPRELRHTFVSLMSEGGVPIEEIARLAGHASSRTTEIVYRRELRPVITTGAQIMGKIFS
jgi:integrase